MTIAKNGDTVAIDYVVRTSDGTVVGGTEQSGPQTLTIGEAEIFPQIETALDGMKVGSEKSITIASGDAFGPRRDELVLQIPRAHLPADQPPQPGMSLSAKNPDGSVLTLVITNVGEAEVTADGNHPLAGHDLHFGLTLIEVKEAA